MPGKPKIIISKSVEFIGGTPASLRKALSKLSPEQQALITGGLEYPIGCLDVVTEDIEVEDNRVLPITLYGDMHQKLDPYEKKAGDHLMLCDNGYLVAPPASGKSIIAFYVAQQLKTRALIVTHRVELARQLVKMAQAALGIVPGIIGGGDRIEMPQITVAVAQSISHRTLGDNYGLLFFDETHHISAPTMVKILKQYSAKHKYGMTAALSGADDREKVFPFLLGNHIVEVTIPDALGRINLPTVVTRDTGCDGAIQDFAKRHICPFCQSFKDCKENY